MRSIVEMTMTFPTFCHAILSPPTGVPGLPMERCRVLEALIHGCLADVSLCQGRDWI